MFSSLLTQISEVAALGYFWLLFLNPLNSTGVRQDKPQRVFNTKWEKKQSVYHILHPQSKGKKRFFVLKIWLWVKVAVGGCAWNRRCVSSVQLTQMFWCVELRLALSVPPQRGKKKFRHVIGAKVHFRSRILTFEANLEVLKVSWHTGQTQDSYSCMGSGKKKKTTLFKTADDSRTL